MLFTEVTSWQKLQISIPASYQSTLFTKTTSWQKLQLSSPASVSQEKLSVSTFYQNHILAKTTNIALSTQEKLSVNTVFQSHILAIAIPSQDKWLPVISPNYVNFFAKLNCEGEQTFCSFSRIVEYFSKIFFFFFFKVFPTYRSVHFCHLHGSCSIISANHDVDLLLKYRFTAEIKALVSFVSSKPFFSSGFHFSIKTYIVDTQCPQYMFLWRNGDKIPQKYRNPETNKGCRWQGLDCTEDGTTIATWRVCSF